ncbi:MAG: hypothetical protein ACXACY_15355 [Candidatus Hodarchaeales archaeon]
MWGGKQQPISDLFKYHIKSKEDGDNFRKWVRSDRKRLSKVKSELNKKGFEGTLSLTGSHTNGYVKLAWNLVGEEYLKSNKGKGLDGVDDYVGMDMLRQDWKSELENYDSEGYIENIKTEQIKETYQFKTYTSAMSNWDVVSKFFGWTSPKTISSENIVKILNREVDVTTCIDPTYILKKQNETWGKMMQIDPVKTNEFLQQRGYGKNSGQVGLGVTVDEPMLHWDIKDGKIIDRDVTEEEKDWYDDATYYNKLDNFLNEVVYPQNVLISLQSKEIYKNACGDGVIWRTRKVPNQGGKTAGTTHDEYDRFYWNSECKPYGGTFMYSTKPVNKLPNGRSVGFTQNSAVCGCVKRRGEIKGKPIDDWMSDNVGDIRSGWRQFEEGLGDCMLDWHCIADIASIAVLALGPVGLLISAGIDLVSTIGYIVENDEGWELNAGLTLIGVIPGFGEAAILAKRGNKFSSKLEDLGKILKSGKGGDVFKLEREIADWSKTLTPNELKYFDEVKKLSTKVGENEEFLKKTLKEIDSQTKNLNKLDKGVLAKIFKKEDPKKIQALFNESGGDIQKMVKSYYKGTKQMIVQGTFFASMYLYSEEIGEWLKWVYDEYGFDPLGIFNESGEMSVPNPESDTDWTQLLKDDPEYFKNIQSELKKIITSFSGGEGYDFGAYLISRKKSFESIHNLKTEWQEPLLEKLGSLDEEINSSTDGYGFEKLNDILSIGIDINNKIQNLKGGETLEAIKNIIDKGIRDVKNINTKKLSDKEKTAIFITSNLEVDPEMVNFIDDLFNNIENDMENKKENDSKVDNLPTIPAKQLKEEINRIKSLFSEERLYGNLINEQPYATDTDGDGNISEPEAIKFLQSLEYVVKANSEEDMCLGVNTGLKKVYDKLKSKSNIGFQLKNTSIGCGLSIYSKRNSPRVAQLDLFEGNTGNRFGMLITVGVSDCCDKPLKDFGGTLGAAPSRIIWNAGQKGWDSGTERFGIGLKTIKIDGTWEIDGAGDIYIKDGHIMKLLDENYKGVPTKIKFGIGSFNANSAISGFSNTGTERGGNKTWMQDSSGACVTLDSFCGEIMGGSINDKFSVESIVNVM